MNKEKKDALHKNLENNHLVLMRELNRLGTIIDDAYQVADGELMPLVDIRIQRIYKELKGSIDHLEAMIQRGTP